MRSGISPTDMATKSAVLLTAALCWKSALAESVPWGYQKVAEAHGVPSDVLYAIALTESTRRLANGRLCPWPWTLNVRGRPERYATRKEAHAALTRHLRQGITRIDVGLMQVNWYYHREKLGSAWEALEPYHNLRVGSKILREEYANAKNWPSAIGRYHAPNDRDRAEHYRQRVESRLRRIRTGG